MLPAALNAEMGRGIVHGLSGQVVDTVPIQMCVAVDETLA